MDYYPIRITDIVRNVNDDWYLPAIQREFVWKTDQIERLFDSILSDFPIGSFLFWNLKEKNKEQWPIYKFISDYDQENPHNVLADVYGIRKDLTLVIDGQQRITSLYIGLKGTYRYFYFRWSKRRLYLNLLKNSDPNKEDPEELAHEFSFRENSGTTDNHEKLWYPVGKILDFGDAEDAKADMKQILSAYSEEKQDIANRLIGRLHNRIHTERVGNYYMEKSQDYDKVLQVFVRANSGGKPLEYSDLLLATATAKWENSDARSEVHNFTDSINEIGAGYKFGKDFVLKACLYLCESLPIQYKVKNFKTKNLLTIENNWDSIKKSLAVTVRLISSFGFHSKDVVAQLALLPIAFYLQKFDDKNFDESTDAKDAETQEAIRKWFIFATLKNAFSGSSDTTLTRLREILKKADSAFPAEEMYRDLDIKPSFSDAEVDQMLGYQYSGRYVNLILSLLYPDKDWKSAKYQQDHIFPQSEFKLVSLKNRKSPYDDAKIQFYRSSFNTLPNLQLLTASENRKKSSKPYHEWLTTRDSGERSRHLIPVLTDYSFGNYILDYTPPMSYICSRTTKGVDI